MAKELKNRNKKLDDIRDDGGAGASASINKTLSEIEAILDGEDLEPSGELRTKLREKLLNSLEEVGQHWYKRGFNRGHREAYAAAALTGKVPRKLKACKARSFTASSQKARIQLRSTVRVD